MKTHCHAIVNKDLWWFNWRLCGLRKSSYMWNTNSYMSFTFKIYKANHTLVKYLSIHILCSTVLDIWNYFSFHFILCVCVCVCMLTFAYVYAIMQRISLQIKNGASCFLFFSTTSFWSFIYKLWNILHHTDYLWHSICKYAM